MLRPPQHASALATVVAPLGALSLALGLVLPACTAAGLGSLDDTSGLAGTASLDSVDVVWEPCSLIDGAEDGLAECATVAMPLFWLHDGGRTFQTAAKRLISADRSPSAQLWLLHGGPGGAGTIGLASWMAAIQEDLPSVDIYTLDPRSAGYSGFLECPDQQSDSSDQGAWVTVDELDACVATVVEEHGDHLEVYGATSAAWDLAALMTATQVDGVPQLLWGGSGGTFWAQRFLQFFPDMAQGVVLEGIVPPTESLVFQDEYDDLIGHRVLELWGQDPFCAKKLPDPEGTLSRLLTDLDKGHCSALGMNGDSLRAFIRGKDYYQLTMPMVPALLYRLDRCDDADFDAIVLFYTTLWGAEANPREQSTLLFYSEGWSELWEHQDLADNTALLAYLDGVYQAANLVYGLGHERDDLYLGWPRYSDPYDNIWADSSVPMLMLQGQLDPSTPLVFAQEVGDHFSGASQTFLQFSASPHNVISGSPMDDNYPPVYCGEQLFYDFIADPQAQLDTSCVDNVAPLDFEGLLYGPYVFGTVDYWDNTPAVAAPSPPVEVTRQLEGARRELRWALTSVGPPRSSPPQRD